jgi:gliding motility-associated-like protein
MLLTAKEDENHHAVLNWNDYEGYNTGIAHYLVYRFVNDEVDRYYIATTNSFTDTDSRLSNRGTLFSYRISAISIPTMTNIRDTAFSNIAPLKRLKSDVWFPNAFSPAGRNNKIFRPIYSETEIEVETYELTIFNRYGAVIFQTTEPKGGWDGRIDGVIATSGGYGYMLKLKTKTGDRIERRGSMLLVN